MNSVGNVVAWWGAVLALLLPQVVVANDAFAELGYRYRVQPGVTYHTADGIDLEMDIYAPRSAGPHPTLVFFHGGGWVGGSPQRSQLALLPWLARGWAAVNVQYRLGGTALAPASAEDTRCAVRAVIARADQYGFDVDRIVLTGQSAGGHLALITAMAPNAADLDQRCAGSRGGGGTDRGSAETPELKVAAVVNWAGITDVTDLIEGPNATSYAVRWLGGQPDRAEVARRVSPLTWVRPGLPPIITIHGDQDRVVPFEHAQRLHQALNDAAVPNQLHPLQGREHFIDFTPEEVAEAHRIIEAFLEDHMR